jgi:site-specific DNA-methyltransferase (adenine-specific)
VIRYYGKHKIIREFSIQEYRSMGSFKTEAGERVTKTFIDHKVRETKAVFVSDAIDEGRNYCWSCGRTDTRLSCSHIISVNDCQNDGRADKAWDYDNLQLECLECHADKAQNNAAMQRIKSKGKSKAGRGYKLYKQTEWDSMIPKIEYWTELFRVSKNQIVWGGNYMTEYLKSSMGWIVWDKGQRDFSLADGEMAWSSFDKAMRIIEISRGKALSDANNNGGQRIHPTQKPVGLYKWLLKNYAKEGDKILDTHLGSGSIAIACHDYGFDLTACELDPDYYEAAMKRINAHVAQQKLFV